MVWVDVTLNGTTRTGFLPVMDHRNKPIPEPDAFQVNTALMRCLTKTLALFGLGLYIYAGEDLPENDPDVKPLPPPGVKQPEPKVDANLALFAEKMKEMVTIATTKDELREFWKANLPGLDSLKTENPDLFKSVLKTFKDAQSQMEQA
jgi:hypothetical protein